MEVSMFVLLVLAMALAADQAQTTTAWIPLTPETYCRGVKDPALCAELLAVTNRDQLARRKQMADRENKSIQDEVRKVDAENLVQIEAVIKAHGWPTKELVGIKGVGAVWTGIQHSSHELQKSYIDMMTNEADADVFDWTLVATTVARIRV